MARSNICSQKEPGDGMLSGMMPDIAMATAQLSLMEPSDSQSSDLQLDLGDGASHTRDGGTLYI
jgi:hypothetical protein